MGRTVEKKIEETRWVRASETRKKWAKGRYNPKKEKQTRTKKKNYYDAFFWAGKKYTH